MACGDKIEKNDTGRHAPQISKVMCTACRPPEADRASSSSDPKRTINPIGGSSALRMHGATRGRNWRKGAAGEYLMDQLLHEKLTDGEVILTNRQVPNAASNIDHIVVASSGVWIIDSKKWQGKIK